MSQTDLFGDMPAAKKPPKSDTPMLLAMDADYVTSAPPCRHCDGTGDVHRADGEWLGTCDCEPEQ